MLFVFRWNDFVIFDPVIMSSYIPLCHFVFDVYFWSHNKMETTKTPVMFTESHFHPSNAGNMLPQLQEHLLFSFNPNVSFEEI